MTAPRDRGCGGEVSSALAGIEDRIGVLEREIAGIAPLVHERARLVRARAVLLGEPDADRPGPAWHPRITRDHVFRHLVRHPGSRAGEIAAALGVGQPAVSAHLYRGKGRLFVSRGERWYPVPSGDVGGRLTA